MTTGPIKHLREALGLGLGTMTRIWEKEAKDWVTGVFAADVDGDGEVEVVACSRDGRVQMFSSEGDKRWKRIIGTKSWLQTVVATDASPSQEDTFAHIVVGTRDGRIYVLNKNGNTVAKDGRMFPFDAEGKDIRQAHEPPSRWFDTAHIIRQVAIVNSQPPQIIIGSDNHYAYGIDYATGKELWSFPTQGEVHTVRAYIKGNQARILVGSVDGYLYLLDQEGILLDKYNIGHRIHTIAVVNSQAQDDVVILVASHNKDLIALSYHEDRFGDQPANSFVTVWQRSFNHRFLSLAIADLDGDGVLEIIAGAEDRFIYILDDKGNRIWRHNHKHRVLSVYPYDIDKDGLPELLLGNDNNRIRVMRVRLHKGLEQRIRKYYRVAMTTNPAILNELTTDERSLLNTLIQPDTLRPVTFHQTQLFSETNNRDKALSKLLQLKQQEVEQCWYNSDIQHVRSVLLRRTADETRHEIIVGTSNNCIYALNVRGRLNWSITFNEHITNLQTRATGSRKREEVVTCTSDQHEYTLSKAQKARMHPANLDAALLTSIPETTPGVQSISNIVAHVTDRPLPDTYLTSDKMLTSVKARRTIFAPSHPEDRIPEVSAESDEKLVSVYAKNKKLLWSREARDPVRAICIKDINGDGQFEVLIGSEDRNIHVVDHAGHLLWRYYLPHTVLSIDVANIHDGQVAVFVGCANGYLYVFDTDGLLLWTYQAKDRIYAVHVEDIDADGNIEIIVGSTEELELLRIVNHQQVNHLIAEHWQALSQQYGTQQAIERLLASTDTFLQVFALNTLVEQGEATVQDFDYLDRFMNSKVPGLRKALVCTFMALYPLNPERAKKALATLWTDSEQDMRNAFIENVPLLAEHDWKLAFNYLTGTFDSSDRFVKRMVIRKLDQLIDVSMDKSLEWQQKIFEILLMAAQEKDSEWVRQEAARTLAHFLNQYHGNLIVYVHLFIVKGVQISVLKDIVYATTVPVVKNFLNAVVLMLDNLDASNVLERLQQVVKALEGISTFIYGKALLLIYSEIYRLFSIETIEEMANYQCSLRASQFDADNKFALHILDIFNRLSIINRPLKMYLRREDVQDRMTSLLDTVDALDRAFAYVDQQYELHLMNEPITRLPDRWVFILLLKKWQKHAFALLSELRGKPELKAELQTKIVPYDNQVSIWLCVENVGRSSASNVQVTLLHNALFEVVDDSSFDIELLLPREDSTLEFTLKPASGILDLEFEITYNDAENQTKIERFKESLYLRESHQAFQLIPNPYSSGVPTHNSEMFYGRENDIAILQNYLTRNTKNVVVLYGQRRSGKTTLLIQLRNMPDTSNGIFVLIDLQNMSYEMESIEKLLHRFAYIIVKALKAHQIALCLPALQDFAINPTYTFDVFLDEVEEHLAGRKLNLLIDEFELLEEHVMSEHLRPQIFEYLRDIVQHRPNINFLFSGTHKITEFTKWYRSVFFNIARHHRISRLDFQGAEDLMVKPVQDFLEYEPHSLTKIHGLTADQPYLIHLLCNAIVEYCNDREKTFVTINDVNAVIQQVMPTGSYHFDWLWDQIGPEVRVALMVLAEGGKEEGRWLSFSEIEALYRHYHLPYRREQVLDALKTLQEADIIESLENPTVKKTKDSRRYKIAVGLIRNWLLQEHSLVSVMSELRD